MDTSSNVTEVRIKYIANQLISTGLAKLGYDEESREINKGEENGRMGTWKLIFIICLGILM